MSAQPRNRIVGLLQVRAGDLVRHPLNFRNHPEAQRGALEEVLSEIGYIDGLIARRLPDGRLELIDGHLRAEMDPNAVVPVLEVDVSEDEAKKVLATKDAISTMAEIDPMGLKALMLDVDIRNPDLSELLDGLANRIPELPDVHDPGPAPEPVVPVSKRGDLWLLGKQRLLCGDSTAADDMRRLMAGEKAMLLATDPPYLVDYQGGNHPQSWANRAEVKDKHWDDYDDPAVASSFFADFLRVALAHCTERVPVYQWHATRRQVLVEEAWKANGLLVHQTLIWVKARAVLTRCHFMWQHEPCFYGWPEGNQPERRPPANERTVWQIDQQGESDGIHPTQKPLAIFERPILWHTEPGELCLEPFSGSGTQLIAAEKHGRRCHAMEIAPAFVDVAVVRWQQATGKQATLEDGRSFAVVSEERKAAVEAAAPS